MTEVDMVETAKSNDAVDREQRDRQAFAAFVKLAELWGLSTEKQITLLGSPARSTFFKWKKDGGQLPSDTLERISHLLNVYKCLTIMFPDTAHADDWVSRPNRYWHNQSALERMMSGKMVDIIDVRRYLDAQRGG